ncbi:hypothetical protein CYY_002201 [Polysphondylium violaceum]|uniref:Uncharacterized protein n=1 Tax=Polysphondylium violaceum TaxID=133409 RepID=A0A8J4PYI4_9MYCE|nr:hypothetical protein CYY_002201 [Polysphondylium violaceum]
MSLEDSNYLLDSLVGTPSTNSMNLQENSNSSDQIFLYMEDQQQHEQADDQQQQTDEQEQQHQHTSDKQEEYHMEQNNDHIVEEQQQQEVHQHDSEAVDESAKQQEEQQQQQHQQYHHHTVYIKNEYQDHNAMLSMDYTMNNGNNNNTMQSPPQQQLHSPPQQHIPAPPAPPPPPTTLTPMYVASPVSAISTQQIIQQQKNLRPITERGQEDKKKEALDFLNFYFRVVPNKKVATLKRATVLALYTNKISVDKRYKQPNDMANLCGAVYTFIFQHLDDSSILEYITSAENERLSASRTDVKKRKRKKTHDVSNGQEVNNHDAFLTCIKYASLLPFIEFVGIAELGTVYSDYMGSHPEWSYTSEDLSKWETELRDQKSNHTGKRLPAIIDQNYRNHYSSSNSSSGSNSMNNSSNGLGIINTTSAFGATSSTSSLITSPTLGETVLDKYNGLLAFSASFNTNNSTNTSNTSNTSPNGSNCNISQLPSPLSVGGTSGSSTASNFSYFSSLNAPTTAPTSTSGLMLSNTNSSGTTNIPVNVSETNENFIIYAFIPFYKPNALKITVNQMDIVLEGVISLPETIQIPNGTEIIVPSNTTTNFTSTLNEIQEGSFYKVIKLSSPIASSTVGKRDGVVVIIAKKEEGQTTIHQL